MSIAMSTLKFLVYVLNCVGPAVRIRKQPVGVMAREKVMDKQQLCTLSHFSSFLSSPLYACETWTVHKRHVKDLKRFHLNCLRTLLKIIWLENLPDTEVLSLTDVHARHSH